MISILCYFHSLTISLSPFCVNSDKPIAIKAYLVKFYKHTWETKNLKIIETKKKEKKILNQQGKIIMKSYQNNRKNSFSRKEDFFLFSM